MNVEHTCMYTYVHTHIHTYGLSVSSTSFWAGSLVLSVAKLGSGGTLKRHLGLWGTALGRNSCILMEWVSSGESGLRKEDHPLTMWSHTIKLLAMYDVGEGALARAITVLFRLPVFKIWAKYTSALCTVFSPRCFDVPVEKRFISQAHARAHTHTHTHTHTVGEVFLIPFYSISSS
jgi:hypothetical protein